MRGFKVEGIILRRSDYSEADRILTIFSKEKGKVRVIAKGVRKLTSRKAAALELFNFSEIFITEGKGMGIVTEAEVKNSFRKWRDDLIRVGVAYYFCEIVDKLTADEEGHREVFELLRNALSKLEDSKLKQQVFEFECKLLSTLGYGEHAGSDGKNGSLHKYIEGITERKINSPGIIKSM
jgi:DNA repair protein RecO (recombination protein O)